MSDNLHRKLADKLRQENEYPDFRHEDWLALDSRLEGFDRRRRRGLLLLFALPMAALAGLSLYLLLRNDRPSTASNPDIEKRTTVVFDTIVKKVTVYEYDTIYRKAFLTGGEHILPSFFNQKNNGPGNIQPPGLSMLDGEKPLDAAAAGQLQLLPFDEATVGVWSSAADSIEGIDYLALRELEFHKKKKHVEASVVDPGLRIKRVPLLHKARTAITAGTTLPQQAGANALPGISAAWEYEFALGQDKLWLWESLGWEQLRLQGREHNGIPGFPKPDSPVPAAKLEQINFESQALVAKLGLGLELEPAKNLSAMLGLGIGGNYRLVSRQIAAFEADHLEDYLRLELPMSTGWAGLSGHVRAGLGWQFGSLWQIRLTGSYGHLFSNRLPDGNIRRWWGLGAGICYRWR
ncbi:MAG: hypothetical protein H6577_02865 [Lewinellaceae bacterium]|nr:hypothetical protein [Saprospiraceae bacterium]MCB9337052.1 hypothetical protein [Lewinellaceae bacterium]